jgi:hypothetical protein
MNLLRSEAEFQAFANLVTAAAVNKRLLMRILAHIEQKDLSVIHDEVAALDAEFREAIVNELSELRTWPPDEPVPPGEIPVGREEERRGHDLPNEDEASTEDKPIPLGTDQQARSEPARP